MEHYRQTYVATDPQSKRDIFDCLKELKCEFGVDVEELPDRLQEYFSDLDPTEALRLVQEWQRYNQAVLESFGIW